MPPSDPLAAADVEPREQEERDGDDDVHEVLHELTSRVESGLSPA
jgi:hypothetical protein